MTHFGLICPASTGHLNPMLSLGQELQRRGNQVTFFGVLDTKAKVLAAGLNFQVIGESEFPKGRMAELFTELGKLSGISALKFTVSWIQKETANFLSNAPQAIKSAGVEALIVDQVAFSGGVVADFLGIPFITVSNALVLHQDAAIPPFFTTWNYSVSIWAKLRNQAGYKLFNYLRKPITEVITAYRDKWNLPPYSNFNDGYSQLAQLSQQPIELEFPRRDLVPWFHFTGPYHNSISRDIVSFPFEKLTGQPLIYASLGTLQNRLMETFEKIAQACVGLDAQLVISLGGGCDPDSLGNLPGSPLVVGYAPQLELLQRATLTITHAGMNTTLESLSNGVPMVAIPITNDQPGVAARIAWTGTGEIVSLKKLNVSKLKTAIKQVLTEESYKNNAIRLSQAIRKAGGVIRAADIIEQAISTGKPVISH